MADFGDLLARLTSAMARTSPGLPLTSRICAAYRDLAGATGAAITGWYGDPHRVTLATTDDLSARLEDLQDVLGEGPGHAAWASGAVEVGVVPDPEGQRWEVFTDAACEVVDSAVVHAVPMRPREEMFGVITLYQVDTRVPSLGLDHDRLQFLANAVGAALVRDSSAPDETDEAGPWTSRAKIHQATGMVVAQLHIGPEDALALLRAHAYAQQTSLHDTAASVVQRRLTFSNP